jgi:plastocyanin
MGGRKASVIPVMAALAALFLVLPSTGADATITITGEPGAWRFEPADLRIEPGQRVVFVNESGQTHTADCVGCPWSTGDVQPAESVFVPFPEESGFTFQCRYHPEQLQGVLRVGDAPVPASASQEPTAEPLG